MKINHTDHIAINTLDIEKTLFFYCDILGLKQEKSVDMGDETLVYVRVNETTCLELCDLRGKCTSKQGYITDVGGLRHIAFDVDNLFEWEEYLTEKGVPFELHMVEMPKLGKRAILVCDPDGTVVELCCDL